jgi:16S rRNA (cytosine967-C5)-methyltransferase
VPEIWARAIGGECPSGGIYLHLSPARHSTDGFFVAAFERAQDETSQAPKS